MHLFACALGTVCSKSEPRLVDQEAFAHEFSSGSRLAYHCFMRDVTLTV